MSVNKSKASFNEGQYLQRIKNRYEKIFPCVTFRDYVHARMNHFKRERITGIKRRYGGNPDQQATAAARPAADGEEAKP